MGNWTLETISWDRFDASKVDPEILRNIKAAALVEYNAPDYVSYLKRVFRKWGVANRVERLAKMNHHQVGCRSDETHEATPAGRRRRALCAALPVFGC